MSLTKADRELLQEIAKTQARLDERSINTWKSVEKIEIHIIAQNGRINKISRNFNILVGGLIGSGVIGGGLWGAFG